MRSKCRTFLFLFTIALIGTLLFAVPSMADEDGDWSYSVKDDLATITAYNGSEKEITIPDSLGGYKVIAIGEEAFGDNISIETVVMPDSIETVESKAFYNCSSLTSVTLSDHLSSIGRSAFEKSKIKSLSIPDSVSFIGAYAFADCTGLRNLTLGNGITEWETDWGTNAAFRGCTLLSSLTLSEGMTSIGSYAFEGCSLLIEVEIPSTVVEISEGAFKDCELLDTVTVYGNVGDKAFQNCSSLKNIELNNVYSIGANAFEGATSLKEIVLTDMLESIGQSAFYQCTKLLKIEIPDSVSYIGAYAFEGCTQLEKIVLGSGITEWGTDWGDNAAFRGCTKLEDITVKEGVAYIASKCFEDCTAIRTISIPGTCERIADDAFRNCSSLEKVELEDGLLYIDNNAFSDDTALTEMTLPDSLLSIGNGAFYNIRVREVNIPDKVMTIGYSAFADNPALRSVRIGESVDSWNTDWGENGAFKNDTRLETLEIADGCMYIGSFAFENCSSLKSVDIPITCTSVDENAFMNCTSLVHVDIQRGEIKENAFSGCFALADLSLQRITSIGENAFYQCTSLYELTLPDTVTSIGKNAFCGCISLSEVYIPDSVTYLGAYAFADCTGLLTAKIESNITEWGTDWGDNAAFAGDTALQFVYIADGANSLGNLMFRDCTELKGLRIPESIVSYETDIFENGSDSVVIYCTGPKAKAIAQEIGVAYLENDLEIPDYSRVHVTLKAGVGGIISPEGKIEKTIGSTLAVSVIPDPGYMVDSYLVNGAAYNYMEAITDIQQDIVIEVTFIEDPEYVDEYPVLTSDSESADAGASVDYMELYTEEDPGYAVAAMFLQGMLSGAGPEYLTADSELSAGPLLVMLHRVEGMPAETSDLITEDTYYSAAAAWALSADIMDESFLDVLSSEAALTLDQLADICAKYAEYKNLAVNIDELKADFNSAEKVTCDTASKMLASFLAGDYQ